MSVQGLVLCAALSIFLIGTYVTWPSRWNIPAHMNLGLVFVAYVVPIVFLDALRGYDEQLIELYTWIVCLGALTYLFGLLIGCRLPLIRLPIISSTKLTYETFVRFVSRRAFSFATLSLITIAACFWAMGFVPALADDPFQAKFFRGEYQQSYRSVAIPYQTARQFLVVLIPITLGLWWYCGRRVGLLLGVLGSIAIALQLTRAPAVGGLLLFLGYVLARKGQVATALYLAIVFTTYIVGAAIFLLFGVGSEGFWIAVAAGSPDVSDHLLFLDSFQRSPELTYGRTFVGGLVPFRYEWNPAIWTLTVINQSSDVSDVISGGLRLPPPLWGYVSFGWAGVVALPLASGLITGWGIKYLKTRLHANGDPLSAILALQFYQIVIGFCSNFYAISIYSIPNLFLIFVLCYQIYINRIRIIPNTSRFSGTDLFVERKLSDIR